MCCCRCLRGDQALEAAEAARAQLVRLEAEADAARIRLSSEQAAAEAARSSLARERGTADEQRAALAEVARQVQQREEALAQVGAACARGAGGWGGGARCGQCLQRKQAHTLMGTSASCRP